MPRQCPTSRPGPQAALPQTTSGSSCSLSTFTMLCCCREGARATRRCLRERCLGPGMRPLALARHLIRRVCASVLCRGGKMRVGQDGPTEHQDMAYLQVVGWSVTEHPHALQNPLHALLGSEMQQSWAQPCEQQPGSWVVLVAGCWHFASDPCVLLVVCQLPA